MLLQWHCNALGDGTKCKTCFGCTRMVPYSPWKKTFFSSSRIDFSFGWPLPPPFLRDFFGNLSLCKYIGLVQSLRGHTSRHVTRVKLKEALLRLGRQRDLKRIVRNFCTSLSVRFAPKNIICRYVYILDTSGRAMYKYNMILICWVWFHLYSLMDWSSLSSFMMMYHRHLLNLNCKT